MLRPPAALPPPTGVPAGWYRDPYGYPLLRYYDGRRWTNHTTGILTPPRDAEAHPTLPLAVAVGAVVVLIASLIASRYLLDALAERGWPLLVLAAIAIFVGYGPSVWWCWFASRRWGSGHLARDVGLRFRWSDTGWGPLVWLAAFGCELAMLLVVQLTGIPLVGNTEGIGNVDADRAYVIALLLTAVVAAPFVEELVFRGLMLRGLLSRIAVVPAVAVQALLFGVAHIDPVRGSGNIGLALVLAAVGVALGGATYLLRRLGPAIIGHALFNGVVLAIVLLVDP